MTQTPSKNELISYGSMALPLSFAGIPIYIHAPDFYATEYGISLANIGLVLLLLRFIDAIQDPFIGYFSDKYMQSRQKIMLSGSFLLAISFALLFAPLTKSYLLWFAIFIFLSTTSFSVLTINLNTIGGIWSKNKNHKTTIVAYREVFGLVGLIFAVTLPSILQKHLSKEDSFLYISCILLALIIITGLIFYNWQKKHFKLNQKKSNNKLVFFKLSNISKQTRNFFLIYGISIMASSIPAVLVLFFIRDRLGLESYSGLFLLTYFCFGSLGIIIWHYNSRKIGKHKSWLISMIIAIFGFMWAYFLGEGDFWPYLAICIISGIAFGADLVLPASILADHIHEKNNQANAAMHFGVMAFIIKLAMALAAILTLPYLESQGFTAGQSNSSESLKALNISYAAVPCIIKLISTYLLWRTINDKNNNLINRSSNHA